MKEKTLAEFPEFVKINTAVAALQREQQEITARIQEIEIELSKPKREVNGQTAWEATLENKDPVRSETDSNSSARQEYAELEGRLTRIREALEVGTMELDRVRGRASLEICQRVRPQWVSQIKIILESLKKISAANEALDVLRGELERENVVTGSLPYSGFDLGGTWNDEYGGKIVGYRRYIIEHFSEVEAAAGMAIKSKLAALAKREQEFREKGAVE